MHLSINLTSLYTSIYYIIYMYMNIEKNEKQHIHIHEYLPKQSSFQTKVAFFMLISQTQLAIFILHSHLFQAVHALVKTHHQTCITVLSQDGTIGAQLHQNGFLCDRTVQLEVSRSVVFAFCFPNESCITQIYEYHRSSARKRSNLTSTWQNLPWYDDESEDFALRRSEKSTKITRQPVSGNSTAGLFGRVKLGQPYSQGLYNIM